MRTFPLDHGSELNAGQIFRITDPNDSDKGGIFACTGDYTNGFFPIRDIRQDQRRSLAPTDLPAYKVLFKVSGGVDDLVGSRLHTLHDMIRDTDDAGFHQSFHGMRLRANEQIPGDGIVTHVIYSCAGDSSTPDGTAVDFKLLIPLTKFDRIYGLGMIGRGLGIDTVDNAVHRAGQKGEHVTSVMETLLSRGIQIKGFDETFGKPPKEVIPTILEGMPVILPASRTPQYHAFPTLNEARSYAASLIEKLPL